MRSFARTRPGRLAHALTLALALAGGMAQAQVATPPVAPVPPAKPDPAPPVSPVPVTPPEQVQPATPPEQPQPATPVQQAQQATPVQQAQPMRSPAAPRSPALPPPPETTPPGVAANQAAELARGDPARWNQPDASAAERLRTQRKEAAAAYEEAKMGCREEPSEGRRRCMKEAKAAYDKDLANIERDAGVR
jgi:outer membrane biosynthesis protein TonB